MHATVSSTDSRARAVRLTAALLAALLAAPAFAQDAAFTASRERWRAAALGGYEYGYRKYCECHPDDPPETVVTVRDGAVVGVRHRPVGSNVEVPAEARNFDVYWTVDGLFDLLQRAYARNAQVRVRYDEQLGYPIELYVDYDANFIGDEVDLKLTQVNALTR
jgi:uncharacterized protein DUF6174